MRACTVVEPRPQACQARVLCCVERQRLAEAEHAARHGVNERRPGFARAQHDELIFHVQEINGWAQHSGRRAGKQGTCRFL